MEFSNCIIASSQVIGGYKIRYREDDASGNNEYQTITLGGASRSVSIPGLIAGTYLWTPKQMLVLNCVKIILKYQYVIL